MSLTPRPVALLSTLAALAAPAVAAIVLAGSGSTPVAASTLTATGSVSAQVVTSPVAVTLPAKAKAPAPRRVVPARAATVTKPAPKPVAKTAVAAPAPKPVAKTAAAPAPKPATTTVTTAVKTADDYPWKSATTNDSDTWGFTKRQCVSFAAFRLAQHGHALNNAAQHWGSALNWDDVARTRGVAVTGTPRVGAIAQWNAGEGSAIYSGSSPAGHFTAGSYGHVGYVAAVYSDGSALIEQYNLGGNRSYSVMRMTAPRYLVF